LTDAVSQPLAGDRHDPEYGANDLDRLSGQQSSPRRQSAQIRWIGKPTPEL
jgi:hypothetical protein